MYLNFQVYAQNMKCAKRSQSYSMALHSGAVCLFSGGLNVSLEMKFFTSLFSGLLIFVDTPKGKHYSTQFKHIFEEITSTLEFIKDHCVQSS